MSAEIFIRRAKPSENDSVQALVQTIADETFAHLFATSPVPIGESSWLPAWLAVSGEEIVGVTMTREEWVSYLWVRCDSRRSGIGGVHRSLSPPFLSPPFRLPGEMHYDVSREKA